MYRLLEALHPALGADERDGRVGGAGDDGDPPVRRVPKEAREEQRDVLRAASGTGREGYTHLDEAACAAQGSTPGKQQGPTCRGGACKRTGRTWRGVKEEGEEV